MYYIDLSFFKSSEAIIGSPEQIELHYNNLFKSLVVEDICKHHRNVSGCLACGPDLSFKTLPDERIIVEAECNGLLGCHFAEVQDKDLQLQKNDMVIIQTDDFVEIAKINQTGEIIRLKRQQSGLYGELLPKILRKMSPADFEQLTKNLDEEKRAKPIFLENVNKFNLSMKLVSIHFQFDRKKLFFFYTSDGRVDFRELAKELASVFKTRIELRQIGVRDEAKKVGGLGTCGREYCCSSFLNNFKRISTQLATDQNLLANMNKLSGPCGKLKCCLSFEAE